MNQKAAKRKNGQRIVSEAQLADALRKNGGIQAAAARVLKVQRSTVCMRVANSNVLKAALKEGREELVEVAEDNISRAIRHKRDIETTKWFLSRRHPDYASKRETSDMTPQDPESDGKRQQVLDAVFGLLEEKVRERLQKQPAMITINPAPPAKKV